MTTSPVHEAAEISGQIRPHRSRIPPSLDWSPPCFCKIASIDTSLLAKHPIIENVSCFNLSIRIFVLMLKMINNTNNHHAFNATASIDMACPSS